MLVELDLFRDVNHYTVDYTVDYTQVGEPNTTRLSCAAPETSAPPWRGKARRGLEGEEMDKIRCFATIHHLRKATRLPEMTNMKESISGWSLKITAGITDDPLSMHSLPSKQMTRGNPW